MAIERRFYQASEAADQIGCDLNMLLELVDFHGLRFFANFDGARAAHFDAESCSESELDSGEHEYASWHRSVALERHATANPDDFDHAPFPRIYKLAGWFELNRDDSLTLLCGNLVNYPRLAAYRDGSRFGQFLNVSKAVMPSGAVVRASDVARFKSETSGPSPAKPLGGVEAALGTRERHGLLRIIKVLAEKADISIEAGGKGAQQIDKALSMAKFSGPKEQMIRNVLAQVRALIPDQ